MLSNNFVVLIPYYNKDFCIEECLDSVEDAAKLADAVIPVILIDDGSTKKFTDTNASRKSYPHLSVIHKWRANTKLSGARYDALNLANEYFSDMDPYVIHLDADDTLAYDTFNKLDKILTKYKDVDIVITPFFGFTDGVYMPYYMPAHNGITSVIYNKIYRTDMTKMYWSNHNISVKLVKLRNWMKVIKNGVSLKINLCEDAYYSAKLYYYLDTMVYVDEYFYRYRYDTAESTTFEGRKDQVAFIKSEHVLNICKFLDFMRHGKINKFPE